MKKMLSLLTLATIFSSTIFALDEASLNDETLVNLFKDGFTLKATVQTDIFIGRDSDRSDISGGENLNCMIFMRESSGKGRRLSEGRPFNIISWKGMLGSLEALNVSDARNNILMLQVRYMEIPEDYVTLSSLQQGCPSIKFEVVEPEVIDAARPVDELIPSV